MNMQAYPPFSTFLIGLSLYFYLIYIIQFNKHSLHLRISFLRFVEGQRIHLTIFVFSKRKAFVTY